MPLIHIAVGGPPCQVDDFPATVGQGGKLFERSCKGALHLRPASTKEITDDELRHLKNSKKHRALAARINVITVVKIAPKAQKPPEKTVLKPSKVDVKF